VIILDKETTKRKWKKNTRTDWPLWLFKKCRFLHRLHRTDPGAARIRGRAWCLQWCLSISDSTRQTKIIEGAHPVTVQ